MRARCHSADRLSSRTLLILGAIGVGILLGVVPLALSNPFPTPRAGGQWILDEPSPVSTAREAPLDSSAREAPLDASAVAVVEVHAEPDRRVVMAALDAGAEEPVTFAERWNLRVPQAPVGGPEPIEPADEAALSDDDDARHDDAGHDDAAAPQPAPSPSPPPPPRDPSEDARHDQAAAPAVRPARRLPDGPAPAPVPLPRPVALPRPAPKRTVVVPVDPVERYLWEVYQRKPVKSDSTGDFTWKDEAAAKRLGMTLRAYVIGGMDPDFREQLYHAGHAMDASGLHWSMLSAFRDDYRQSLAAGFKAHGGNSLHGGSRATGGYTHGRAIDIASAGEGEPDAIWHWIDAHGAKYGLTRPMRGIDPSHVQARGAYHDLAHDLREARLRLEARLNGGTAERTTMVLRADR